MKIHRIHSLLLTLALAASLLAACTKEPELPQPAPAGAPAPTLAEMKAWYSSGPTGHRSLTIAWNKPDTIANGAEPLAFVPIEATQVEFTSHYQGYRRLVVGKSADAPSRGFIIEVVHKGSPLAPSQVKQAFRHAYNSYVHAPQQPLRLTADFTGFAAVYSRENQYLTGRSFAHGVPSALPDWLEFLPGDQARSGSRGLDVEITCVRSITHYTVSGDDVITWSCSVSSGGGGGGTGGGTGGSGGGTGGSTGGGHGAGGGSSGGGGGSGPIPNDPYDDGSGWGGDSGPTQTARIINHLPPCLNQAYISLLGAIALHASQMSAAGFPSSFLPLSYFTGPSHDWELHAGALPTDHLGQTHIDANNNNQVITVLDDQQMRNATDLLVMGLIMHESVHAYLVAYFANDNTKFGLDYPGLVEAMFRQSQSQQNNTQHSLMVTDFKDEIGQVLYTYATQLGYNISLQYCQDLAWNGLEKTAAFQALSQSEKTRIANVINCELSGVNAKGLKPSGC